MARHGPVGHFRRALADHDLGGDEGLATTPSARPRHPQRPPCAQAGGQLAAQRAPTLHVERLVDGFVADAHGLIVREVEPQAAGDLLRAPGSGPSPVLPRPVPAALPWHNRTSDCRAAWCADRASQPVLDIPPQRGVDHQLRRLGAPGGSVGVPLGGGGSIVQAAASRVAALRRNSREIVDAARPSRRATSRTLQP